MRRNDVPRTAFRPDAGRTRGTLYFVPDPDPDLSLLPGHWEDVRGSIDAAELAAELAREIPVGHILAGRSVAATAVKRRRKEVIFRLTDDLQWAWVHLTWNVEQSPQWPSAVICDSWGSLIAELTDQG